MKARTSRVVLVSLICLALLATFSASGARGSARSPTLDAWMQDLWAS